jgi:hypothetical protein
LEWGFSECFALAVLERNGFGVGFAPHRLCNFWKRVALSGGPEKIINSLRGFRAGGVSQLFNTNTTTTSYL